MAISTITRQYVICFDGTGNTAENETAPTNVLKLHDLLAGKKTRDVYYVPGVGTRVGEAISGNAWGAGIRDRLEAAYRWLTDQLNYQDRKLESYQIYVFGFSRGAYLARVFCWLLAKCGVPDNANLCAELFTLFLREDPKLIEQWKSEHQNLEITEIEMLGVWDTVKTADFRDLDSTDAKLAPNVKAAFHAMALDELRNLFPVLRFNRDPRVRELWFAGIHSDVGGGYRRDGLSNIALQWMLDQAMDRDLTFRKHPLVQNSLQPLHDEFNKLKWQILCKARNPLASSLPRRVAKDDMVHSSVEERINAGFTLLAQLPAKLNFVDC